MDNENGTSTEAPPAEDSPAWSGWVTDRILTFMTGLVGHELRPYQVPLARRMILSVLENDAETITALAARQSGKSESLTNTVAALMVLLPVLAKIYPTRLGMFKDGLWVGIFAPVEEQANTLFGRLVDRLTSEHAQQILADPDIDDVIEAKTRNIRFKRSGSRALMMTANPRAKIESKSFHLILIDEAQDCFPAETPVLTSGGWVPIGEIANGAGRDWVVAAQDSDGALTWSHVVTAYRTPRHRPLVRVDHELGSVYSTSNHPFLVGDARVPAGDLKPGTYLSVVQGADQPARVEASAQADHGRVQARVLAGVGSPPSRGEGTARGSWSATGELTPGQAESQGRRAHAAKQPHVRLLIETEDGFDIVEDWTPTFGTRREWAGDDGAAAAALGALGERLGSRVCLPNWTAPEGRTSLALQGGPGEPGTEAGSGDRRGLSQVSREADPGLPQGAVAVQSRVVGVEVLEPGNSEFDQFSDRADYVYTLKVEHESHTFVAGGVLVGNCDDFVLRKSVSPMVAAYAGTVVMTGTPTTRKGYFYATIQHNKRRALEKRGGLSCHYQWDWREVIKYNEQYKKFVLLEIDKMGEDADEFQMSFNLKWLLEQGMFTTSTRLDELGDVGMQELVKSWVRTPVCVGIDCARTQDSTVVTVVWVDWDRPDEFGMFEHRVLNWLELQGVNWEDQYFQILRFLEPYNIYGVAIDAQGVGDAVAERLGILLRRTHPHAEVHPLKSNSGDQSRRWKHLMTLMDRGKVAWPAGAKVRRLRSFQRFYQQMSEAEKHFQGPNMLVKAPEETGAHDDYPQSLALACWLTAEQSAPQVEVVENVFFKRSRR